MKIAQLLNIIWRWMTKEFHRQLPRSVYLYFMHGNSLDYKKCAFCMQILLLMKMRQARFMQNYRDEMEEFTWNQLEKRNIDEDLRIIYKRFLVETDMSQDRIRAVYDVCHAYWITTKVPNMAFIHVIAA